ncbi:hypothetical protein NHQ30_009194 [Ciborinia camelliae]|nr:hypothetical protein NHQ30_009194 [Ciborinia camelliae]
MVVCITIRVWAILKLRPIKWAWGDLTFTLAVLAAFTLYIALITSLPTGIVGLVLDTYLFLVPLVAVSRLKNMTIRKRFAIALIFGAGFLAIITSILSIIYRARLHKYKDYTWNLTPVCAVAAAELFIGIIIACTPHIVKFLRTNEKAFIKIGSGIAYYLCYKYGFRKEVGVESKKFESTQQMTPNKPTKLYPALDISTQGGTLEGTNAD